MSPPDGPFDGAPGIGGMWPPDPERRLGDPGYPAPWTTDEPLEALRDEEEAIVVSLAPDVALTPIGEAELVHVPYPIVDFCSDDEHYTPSVRFTGQRAMVMRSRTTCVHGAEAGTGGGAVAGVCGGICEPIEHAPAVRAEGSHVIRHLDRFWMDDRNTQGEAYFVRDTATYDPPPDDDPLPGSLRLIEGGGREETLQGDAGADVLLAEAQEAEPRAHFYQAPSPSPAPVEIPTPPAEPRPTPTPAPSPPPLPKTRGGLGRLSWFGALIWGWELGQAENERARQDPEGYMAREAERYRGVESLDPGERAIHDRAVERLRRGTPQGPVREDYHREIQRYRNRQEEAELLEELERPQAEEEEPQPAPAPPPPGRSDARVSAREEYRRRCEVARYGRMRKICGQYGMEAHHIVPDWTLRYGSRDDSEKRIPNMPSLLDGMSICVLGNASTPNTEHNRAHIADGAIHRLAVRSKPEHTATVRDVTRVSAVAMIAVRPDCAAQIRSALAGQFGSRNQDQLLRAKRRPPLPPDTVDALKSGAIRGAASRP